MLLVELRPKKWQEAVTAMEAWWCRGSEIGEEREASGLAEQGPHIAPVGACEAQSPEQTKLDHARPRRCAAQSRGMSSVGSPLRPASRSHHKGVTQRL